MFETTAAELAAAQHLTANPPGPDTPHGTMAGMSVDAAPINATRYRAEYSDPTTRDSLEPAYDSLEAAQKRCEDDLRAAWGNRSKLTLTWEPATGDLTYWVMKVRTPALHEPVNSGYAVTVFGSDWDVSEARTSVH